MWPKSIQPHVTTKHAATEDPPCRAHRGEYAGDAWGEPVPCVLKEYSLDEAGKEWKKLVTEVTLLARLSHPHIVEVQAVFQQIEPRTRLNMAYVQLPFYAHGDAARWLDECDPPPPLEARQRVLQQLAQALQHVHALSWWRSSHCNPDPRPLAPSSWPLAPPESGPESPP